MENKDIIKDLKLGGSPKKKKSKIMINLSRNYPCSHFYRSS